MSRRLAGLAGLVCIFLGILALVTSEGSPVLPEKHGLPTGAYENDFLGDLAGVLLFGLLVTLGLLLIIMPRSPAPRNGRVLAATILALALPFFLGLQTALLINVQAGSINDSSGREEVGILYFTASYFFHGGETLRFGAVYVLFFTNLLLVTAILGSVGYLLWPRHFLRALADPRSWAKNEALHVAATLLLVLSLGVVLYNLFHIVQKTDHNALGRAGFLASNLPALYYLLIFVLGLLLLTVATHTFLLNWGLDTPLEFRRLVESIRTVSRIERGLLIAAGALNALIMLLPPLPTRHLLSTSLVFGLSVKGFSGAIFLLLLPYVVYALSERRLSMLLRAGRGIHPSMPFSASALRLTLVHLSGLVLLLALADAARWTALGLMIALSAWTAGVAIAFALRVRRGQRLPGLELNGEAGAPLYFFGLAVAITTGLMLWGRGNMFEVVYETQTQTLVLENPSYYGEDLLARLGAVALLVGGLLLTLHLMHGAAKLERRFMGHHLAAFLLTSMTLLMTFTIGVWTRGDTPQLGSAYAGFNFRQYYALESTLIALLVLANGVYLYFALGKMISPMVEKRHGPLPSPPFQA